MVSCIHFFNVAKVRLISELGKGKFFFLVFLPDSWDALVKKP